MGRPQPPDGPQPTPEPSWPGPFPVPQAPAAPSPPLRFQWGGLSVEVDPMWLLQQASGLRVGAKLPNLGMPDLPPSVLEYLRNSSPPEPDLPPETEPPESPTLREYPREPLSHGSSGDRVLRSTLVSLHQAEAMLRERIDALLSELRRRER